MSDDETNSIIDDGMNEDNEDYIVYLEEKKSLEADTEYQNNLIISKNNRSRKSEDTNERRVLFFFIAAYKNLPELWNPQHKLYCSKLFRTKAYEKLLPIYRKMKPQATLTDLRKKINALRSNYRAELRKIMLSKNGDTFTLPPTDICQALSFLGTEPGGNTKVKQAETMRKSRQENNSSEPSREKSKRSLATCFGHQKNLHPKNITSDDETYSITGDDMNNEDNLDCRTDGDNQDYIVYLEEENSLEADTESDQDNLIISKTDRSCKSEDTNERRMLFFFIAAYENLPELWNPQHKLYCSQSVRAKAYEKLLPIYRKIKPQATITDVRKKINILRSNYRGELRKIMLSKNANTFTLPPTDICQALSFLGTEPVGNATDKQEVQMNRSQTRLLNQYLSNCQARPTRKSRRENNESEPRPKKSKRNIPDQKHEKSMKTEDNLLNTQFLPQALVWARKLEALTATQRIYAEKAINDILFKAESGNLKTEINTKL